MKAWLLLFVALALVVGPARRPDPPGGKCAGRIVVDTGRARACLFPR